MYFMKRTRLVALTLGVLGLASALSLGAFGQQAKPQYQSLALELRSGVHDGVPGETFVAYEEEIYVPAVPWMRLHFSRYDLGKASYVTVAAAHDGAMQRLNAVAMDDWYGGTAIFNGDRLTVRLHVAPQDTGVFVDLSSIDVGTPSPEVPETICGSDDRVASSDNRVGRLFFGGCTAWRVTNGAFLTAGHCVDLDPDGVIDLTGVVEFNVPASQSSGVTVAASPNDQYPINLSSVVWEFEGSDQGTGHDWAVFAVNRNANTGLLPHEAYGLPFRMTRQILSQGSTTRITGFGADDGTANFTNQTATGPFVDENFNSNGVAHEYLVDTMGGNSGSPIIWEAYGLTIGIHTNGGCGGSSGNYGTSFEYDALENALQAFAGPDVRYIDVGHPLPTAEEGTVFRPYDTVAEGVANVPSGGILSIVAGEYSSGITIAKPMTILAPVGVVTIGN